MDCIIYNAIAQVHWCTNQIKWYKYNTWFVWSLKCIPWFKWSAIFRYWCYHYTLLTIFIHFKIEHQAPLWTSKKLANHWILITDSSLSYFCKIKNVIIVGRNSCIKVKIQGQGQSLEQGTRFIWFIQTCVTSLTCALYVLPQPYIFNILLSFQCKCVTQDTMDRTARGTVATVH